jgi:hypothetical protein
MSTSDLLRTAGFRCREDRYFPVADIRREKTRSRWHWILQLLTLALFLEASPLARAAISADYSTASLIVDDILNGTVSGGALTNSLVGGGNISVSGAASVTLMSGGI